MRPSRRGARLNSVRDWLVGGAVVEQASGVLLVRNLRRNGMADWSPPGGVIDKGETVLDGLAREVLEETGLAVTTWSGPIYEVHAEAPDLGWRLRAEIHLVGSYGGDLQVDDPDGIVVDAAFVSSADCTVRLAQGPPWVREPLLDWLVERWSDHREYRYLVEGTDLASLDVIRM
jgi:8-oxo-dGTP diphosphatase